jgi:hypothetical protein
VPGPARLVREKSHQLLRSAATGLCPDLDATPGTADR